MEEYSLLFFIFDTLTDDAWGSSGNFLYAYSTMYRLQVKPEEGKKLVLQNCEFFLKHQKLKIAKKINANLQ